MSGKKYSAPLSPTVSQVIDEFIGAVKADDTIDNAEVARLEQLLRQGTVPKPEDISTALFDPPSEDGA